MTHGVQHGADATVVSARGELEADVEQPQRGPYMVFERVREGAFFMPLTLSPHAAGSGTAPDQVRARRMMEAMLTMGKIQVEELRRAFDGEEAGERPRAGVTSGQRHVLPEEGTRRLGVEPIHDVGGAADRVG